MMRCSGCQKELTSQSRVASISASIMGDEYSESYYFCPSCQVYTVNVARDRFDGDGEVSENSYGPVSKEKGDEKVALIGKCDRPYEKKCRCEAHRAYFEGSLD
jgi:hypothetical protein